MTETIEVNERPLSPEEIDRDYIGIKAAAEIFGDVSEKTARKYLSSDHGINIQTIDRIINGGVGKLYRKSDVITVAGVLKKIPSVIHYETVTVKPQVEAMPDRRSVSNLPKEALTDSVSMSFPKFLKASNRYFIGTLVAQVLTIAVIVVGFNWYFHRQSRQIASLKSFIEHKKIYDEGIKFIGKG